MPLIFSCGDEDNDTGTLSTKLNAPMLDDGYTGKGTYSYGYGSKYVGEFKDGEKHGQGTSTYADGSKYVGEFKDGRRNGQGTYTTADGTVKEGLWENGKFIGE